MMLKGIPLSPWQWGLFCFDRFGENNIFPEFTSRCSVNDYCFALPCDDYVRNTFHVLLPFMELFDDFFTH